MHVSPRETLTHAANCIRGNTILSGQRYSRCIASPDCCDGFLRQHGRVMRLAPRKGARRRIWLPLHPTLVRCVTHIIVSCSKEQMIGIHARAIIATMTHLHLIGDFPSVEQPCRPVSAALDCARSHLKQPIPRFGHNPTFPEPTSTIGFRDIPLVKSQTRGDSDARHYLPFLLLRATE